MTVRIYTHRDVGGPGLSLTGTNLEKLYQILVPCLVNGYSGKPAAGWTLEQNLSGAGFTLKSMGGGYLNFTRNSNNAYGVMVYLLESLTSIAASPPSGQNLRSSVYSLDTNAGSTSRHWLSFYSSQTLYGWMVVATDKTFILSLYLSNSTVDVNGATVSQVFAAGAMKLHAGLSGVQNFHAIGGDVNSSTFTSSVAGYPFYSGHTSLRDPLTGAVVSGAGSVIDGRADLLQAQSGYYTKPNNLPPVLRLNPLHLRYGTEFVGYVPGVLQDPIIGHYTPSGVMSALGLTPTFEAWDVPTVIGGVNVWPLPCLWGLLFVTDNEAYW